MVHHNQLDLGVNLGVIIYILYILNFNILLPFKTTIKSCADFNAYVRYK